MGRIKTIPIKKATLSILKTYGNELPVDFEKIKEMLPNYIKTPSKKVRNAIAGYLVRLLKMQQLEKHRKMMEG